MKRQPYFGHWKNIFSISFGLVYVMFTLWAIFHTQQFVPANLKDFWWGIFISYGVLNSIIFGNADLRNKLFEVTVIKFVPRFLLYFIACFTLFYLISNFIDPLQFSMIVVLKNIPLWLAVIHALIFATTESVIWQGYLDDKIGHPWSELTAGVFHWGIWSGGALVVIPSAALLFMMFSGINWYFRNSKNDLVPAIASHTAFNFVKLGLMALK